MLPVFLLIAALALYLYFLRADLSEYRLFRRLGDTGSRQHRYRMWVVKPMLLFALPTLVALALLGRLDALHTFPPEFAPLVDRLGLAAIDFGNSGFILGAATGGVVAGALLATALTWKRQRRTGRQVMLGNVDAMLPRNRAELGHAAVLSVSAGLTEELFFRLLLPLLIALVTGSALIAFAAATALFGAAHRYQGWVGVLATTVLGALFALLYLATGSLWTVIAVHIALDLAGLVLRPALSGAWRA